MNVRTPKGQNSQIVECSLGKMINGKEKLNILFYIFQAKDDIVS